MVQIKEKLIFTVYATFSVVALLSAFYSALEFTFFISTPNYYTPRKPAENLENGPWLRASWSLLIDCSLISLFILQHSLMALPAFKRVFDSSGIEAIQRNVYVILTSLALQLLVQNWQPTPDIAFWRFTPNRLTWWLFVLTHSFLWILIYVGNICADVNELLGIKQVYYYIKKLPRPQQYKSPELVRLNDHMRHPSFSAFVLLFWVSPTMSLDRALLATLFSCYMYLTWRTDHSDYRYQEIQYRRKFHELQRL